MAENEQNLEGNFDNINSLMSDFEKEISHLKNSELKNDLFADEIEAQEQEEQEQEAQHRSDGNANDDDDIGTGYDDDCDTGDDDEGNAKNIGAFIPPEIIIEGGNILIATLLSLSLTMLKKPVDKKDLMLDASEKRAIKKPLENWLATLDYEAVSPLNQLLLVLGIIYMGKLAPVLLTTSSGETVKEAVKATKSKGRGRPKKEVN